MLLETLDLRTNDILIYSQNLFNFNENFKIINKSSKIKKAQNISYFDVCNFVKDPSPKNLIIYRLLTNVNSLDAYSTKYGYFIKINGRMELIYFDPVYAIKDLRHLRFELDPGYFRFKIQQVGLTSLTNWENEPNFGEVYSFDLKAIEAQNQNDKIFADAIFAFDPNFSSEHEDIPKKSEKHVHLELNKNHKVELDSAEISSLNIAEDKTSKKNEMILPKAPDASKATDLREEIISLLKQALNIPEQVDKPSISLDIPKNPGQQIKSLNIDEEIQNSTVSLLDLFKSTHKAERLSDKEKESVILKFESK